MLFSSGELKYCDYVSNYTWEIEWVNYSQYYNRQNGQTNKIKRNLFELKVCTAIGIKHLNYFEDQKGLNNLQSYLRNLLSEKIFNFVYRNRNQFTQQDLWQLSILPFEQLILGSQKEFEEQNYRRVQICLEIWFNQNQLLNLKEGIYVSIEELRNNVQIGDSSEKWAYRAGVTYRFLVSKQAGQKNLELENIVRSHQNQTVKNAIVKKLEQRSHALDEGELKQFRLQLAELLAFNKFDGVNFKELKPYFYAGYIDQIKNERKIGGDSI
jgi:hypothetical protein